MIFTIFLILAWILFCIVSYRNIVHGLAVIIVLLPSYLWRFSILGLPSTFLELMILSIFVIWLLKDKKFLRINVLLKPKAENRFSIAMRILLTLWLVASIIGFLVNPTYATLGLWRAYFLEPILFTIVLVYSIHNKKDLRFLINALGILVAWLFVAAIYQNFSTWNYIPAYNFPNVKRLTSVFSYPNALSLLIAPLTTFLLGLWIYAKEKKTDILYLVVGVLGLSLAWLAHSEGALLGIFTALIIWLIFAKKVRKYGIPLVLFGSIIVFGLIGGASKLGSLQQQLMSPQLGLQATSLEIRSSQWTETIKLLGDRFLTGSGLNGYQTAISQYHNVEWLEVYLYPHNIFLNFWTELSFFGLLVFLALMIYVICSLKKLFRNGNSLAWPLTLLWLTWFVHGLVDVPYFKNDLSVLFFIFLAITFLTKRYKLDFEK